MEQCWKFVVAYPGGQKSSGTRHWIHSRLCSVASQEHVSILVKEGRWLGRLLQGWKGPVPWPPCYLSQVWSKWYQMNGLRHPSPHHLSLTVPDLLVHQRNKTIQTITTGRLLVTAVYIHSSSFTSSWAPTKAKEILLTWNGSLSAGSSLLCPQRHPSPNQTDCALFGGFIPKPTHTKFLYDS